MAAAAGPAAKSLKTLFGTPVGWKKPSACPEEQKFQEFKADTVTKRAAAIARQCRRRAGQEPYPPQAPRKNHMYRGADPAAAPAAASRPLRAAACPGRVLYLNLAEAPLSSKGPRYVRTASASRMPPPHLLVLQDLAAADLLPQKGDLLVGMLAAVSLGIPIVDRCTWERETDPLRSEDCVRHAPSGREGACDGVFDRGLRP